MAQFNLGASLLGAMLVYVTLMPAVLSLIPGVLRACLRIKALIPESILPGLFLVAATPLYILLFLVIFTTINQAAGNIVLILGVLALVGRADVLYAQRAHSSPGRCGREEEVAKIGSVQNLVLAIMGIGAGVDRHLCLHRRDFRAVADRHRSADLGDPALGPEPAPVPDRIYRPLAVHDGAGRRPVHDDEPALWKHTKDFQASPDAESYDRLMTEIEEAGGAPQPQPRAPQQTA